jgi:uncharacterized membrane protein required for colicin V production
MILAIALGISILMAWLGVKKGVYVMAAALFNLLIAFYVSLLAIPLVFKTSPGLETSGYYAALCLLVLIAACFLLLQGICYYLFLHGADLVFPNLFDKFGGALLGFTVGYILTAILCLGVCMTPFSHQDFKQGFFPSDRLEDFCSKTSSRACHFISAWSLQYIPDKPEETIEYLLSLGQKKDNQPINMQNLTGTHPPSKHTTDSKPAQPTLPESPKNSSQKDPGI